MAVARSCDSRGCDFACIFASGNYDRNKIAERIISDIRVGLSANYSYSWCGDGQNLIPVLFITRQECCENRSK